MRLAHFIHPRAAIILIAAKNKTGHFIKAGCHIEPLTRYQERRGRKRKDEEGRGRTEEERGRTRKEEERKRKATAKRGKGQAGEEGQVPDLASWNLFLNRHPSPGMKFRQYASPK
jgi:hypothetical protein